MPITLSSIRDQIESRLIDTSNLTFSTNTLDEAIRAALADLSNAYGSEVTLKDLDSALSTTFDDLDLNVFVVGGVAYALRFRLVRKFEQAVPDRDQPDDLARLVTEQMDHFQSLLTQIRLRRFQESIDSPYSAWVWDESEDGS